jgi:serine/threonine protein phosphatase PrpC
MIDSQKENPDSNPNESGQESARYPLKVFKELPFQDSPDLPNQNPAVDDSVQSNAVEPAVSLPESVEKSLQPNSTEPVVQTQLSDEAVLQYTRSLWREVDPTDLSDPTDHTDKDQRQGKCGGVLIGASRRGKSHAQDGKYREDSFIIDVQDSWLLMAVADGTGSKPLARVGSKIAVSSAIRYIKDRLANFQATDQIPSSLRGALAGAMVHALARISDEAACRQKEANDFATTLLLAVYGNFNEKRWLGIAQVGDGGIAIQKQNGECSEIGRADHGQFGGEAIFLTSQEAQMSWNQRAFVLEVQDDFQLLAVATDGVFDDFSPPFGQMERLFQVLHQILTKENLAASLLEWLNYERRGSFDDRTLVVLIPAKG